MTKSPKDKSVIINTTGNDRPIIIDFYNRFIKTFSLKKKVLKVIHKIFYSLVIKNMNFMSLQWGYVILTNYVTFKFPSDTMSSFFSRVKKLIIFLTCTQMYKCYTPF